MPRSYLSLLLAALAPALACSPPNCAFERIAFTYMQADTSDSLQPGGRAGVGLVVQGNPTLRLSQLDILAYADVQTAMSATVYAGKSLSDAPDAGSVVAQGSAMLPPTTAAPSDPSAIPSVAFTLTSQSGTPPLNANAVYFVVLTAETQPVTLGIATAGLYDGSYQTYGTSGWTPSPISSERVALSLQSPSCD